MNSIEEKSAETRILRRTAEESKKCYTCPDGYLESLADTMTAYQANKTMRMLGLALSCGRT